MHNNICRQCTNEFKSFYKRQLYCSTHCRNLYHADKRFYDPESYTRETRYKRDAEKRDKIAELHQYDIGDTVRVRGRICRVLLRIERGDTVKDGWERLLDDNPDYIAGAPFDSIHPVKTQRYFVGYDRNDKTYVYCPYLHNITQFKADEDGRDESLDLS